MFEIRSVEGFKAAGKILPSREHLSQIGSAIHSKVAPALLAAATPLRRACWTPGPSVVRINGLVLLASRTTRTPVQGHSYLTTRQLIIPSPRSSCLPTLCPQIQTRPSRFRPLSNFSNAASASSAVVSKKSSILFILILQFNLSSVNANANTSMSLQQISTDNNRFKDFYENTTTTEVSFYTRSSFSLQSLYLLLY